MRRCTHSPSLPRKRTLRTTTVFAPRLRSWVGRGSDSPNFGAAAQWILAGIGLRGILAELEHDHPKIGELIRCHLGVKTGLNRVFLNPPVDLEPEVLRWAVRGRDLRAFRCQSRVTLLWGHDCGGRPLPRLPPRAQTYLSTHAAALRARRDYQGGPLWSVFRAGPAVARYRVVWADLARRLTAAHLTSRGDLQRIPLNTCYVAPVHSAQHAGALVAWLNSTWVRAVARLGAVPASSGFARFNARVVAQLPLPSTVLTDPELVRVARAGRSGMTVQDELDSLAARHLGLSSSAQSMLRGAVDSSSHHCR